MQKKHKYSSLSLAILSILSSEAVFAAANFRITPSTPLPAQNSASGVLSVVYNVTNLTSSTRSGYRVEGLPSNVEQVVGVDTCSDPITLTAGASCNLQLDVTGFVDSFFAICKGSSCTTASQPLSVSIFTQSSLIAVGYDSSDPNNLLPLIAQSAQQGNDWEYASLPGVLPNNATRGSLRSAACIGAKCVSVGEDEANGDKFYLIASTQDSGASWQYAQTPSLIQSGLYGISSVSATTFVAVGRGQITPPNYYTRILLSTDSGANWEVPSDYTIVLGILKSVSCSGLTCVAVGQNNTSGTLPYIAVSSDGGHNWTASEINTDISAGTLNSASCFGSRCAVVGNDGTHPLLVSSHDRGANWYWQPLGDYTGTFYSVFCTKTKCTAVGYGNTTPLIATSFGGDIWETSTLTNPNNTDSFTLRSVSCNAVQCLAAGDNYVVSTSPTSYVGIIAQSDANTSSWSYVSPADGIADTTYKTVSCDNRLCFAAGDTGSNTPGTTGAPFITEILNLSTTLIDPLLPVDVTLGSFDGSGAKY